MRLQNHAPVSLQRQSLFLRQVVSQKQYLCVKGFDQKASFFGSEFW